MAAQTRTHPWQFSEERFGLAMPRQPSRRQLRNRSVHPARAPGQLRMRRAPPPAIANPTRASFPSVESNTRFTSPRISPRSSLREAHRKYKKVTQNGGRGSGREGKNAQPHLPSGAHVLVSKMTRLAGLEIGKIKLAAFAINAQANKYGLGSTFALRTHGEDGGSQNHCRRYRSKEAQ